LDNSQQNGWREPREFRNMRWEGGTEAAAAAPPASKADVTPPNLEETIQKEIRKSVDQENRDVRTRR
jgi:hypothetical protein